MEDELNLSPELSSEEFEGSEQVVDPIGSEAGGYEGGESGQEGQDLHPQQGEIERLRREIENLKGLQGTVQQKEEQNRRLQGRLAQLEAIAFQERTRHMPPQQRMAEMQRWQEAQRLQRERDEIEGWKAQMSMVAERQAQEDTYRYLSQKYKVPITELRQRDTGNPWELQGWASARAELRKEQKKEQRINQGNDNFGNTSGTPAPRKPASSLDEAGANFVAHMSRFRR